MSAALTLPGQEHIAGTQPSVDPVLTSSAQVTLPTSAIDIDLGRRLFLTHCASCHGPGGEGGKGPTLALPKLPRASDDASLLRIVRDGISGTEMPRTRFNPLDAPRVAAFVKSLGARPVEQVPGDPRRGGELYLSKGQCMKCHTIHGEGGIFGPDLSDIGRRRSAAFLRRAIIDPNAEVPQYFSPRNEAGIPQNFLYLRIVTRDGERFEGVRVNEDTFSIQLREVPGKVRSFFKSELTELHKDWGKSAMPSYNGAFTADELDDLVAFMVSQREHK